MTHITCTARQTKAIFNLVRLAALAWAGGKSRKLRCASTGVEAARARPPELEAIGDRYAIALTSALAALIDPADPAGPIAHQFVPDARELVRDTAAGATLVSQSVLLKGANDAADRLSADP